MRALLALLLLAPALPAAQAEPLVCTGDHQVCVWWWTAEFQQCFAVDVIVYAAAVSHQETVCTFDFSPCQPNCAVKVEALSESP